MADQAESFTDAAEKAANIFSKLLDDSKNVLIHTQPCPSKRYFYSF